MDQRRFVVVVVDSAGCGAMPDAGRYGDEGSDTLGNTSRAVGGLHLPNLGRLVRRLHADLPGVLGSIVVESRPPGAQVQIDDEPAGVTPLTIPNIRLDQRHRVDLALIGRASCRERV